MTIRLHFLLIMLIITNNASFIADILHLRIKAVMQRVRVAHYDIQLIKALEQMGDLVYRNSTTLNMAIYANS